MPVDLYVGGVEHAVLHLLYARFWHKVLYDCGLVHTLEPFRRCATKALSLPAPINIPKAAMFHPEEVSRKRGRIFSTRRTKSSMPNRKNVEIETQRRHSR